MLHIIYMYIFVVPFIVYVWLLHRKSFRLETRPCLSLFLALCAADGFHELE